MLGLLDNYIYYTDDPSRGKESVKGSVDAWMIVYKLGFFTNNVSTGKRSKFKQLFFIDSPLSDVSNVVC